MKVIILFVLSLTICAQVHTCPDKDIEHNYYSICFNKSKKLARWVTYNLNEEMFTGYARRTDRFKIDPKAPNSSPTPKHYQGSGYDRGHLAPAGDMKINQLAMDESFFMTNISAQEPSFNRGIWKRLENLMRRLVRPNRNYHIITGPIFEFKKKSHKTRFLNIPKAFFKIIFYQDIHQTKVLAFLLPNQKSSENLKEFLVPVNTIEALTGLDFFTDLNENIESSIESKINTANWDI